MKIKLTERVYFPKNDTEIGLTIECYSYKAITVVMPDFIISVNNEKG